MRINTNISSLRAQESNQLTSSRIESSLQKLSTGLRINQASDDASGLSIADKLRTTATSLGQAVNNGNAAVSLTQIADKAMEEQSHILDVIKQKLMQASTSTTSSAGMEAISKDIIKLMDQIDNIADQTTYNGTALLKGGKQSAGDISGIASAQVGLNSALFDMRRTKTKGSANTEAAKVKTAMTNLQTAKKVDLDSADSLKFQMGQFKFDVVGTTSGTLSNTVGMESLESAKLDIIQWDGMRSAADMQSAARGLLENIDKALDELNGWRADFGSTQNQLESSVRNIMTQVTNTKAAESIIRDVDYAQESANFQRQNIISQAGTYALSQANATAQNVMRLLQ